MTTTRQIIDAFGPGVRVMYLQVDAGTIGRNTLEREDTWNLHAQRVRECAAAFRDPSRSEWKTDNADYLIDGAGNRVPSLTKHS